MNPQMQNYRQYAAQQQARTPANARRPGESALNTCSAHSYQQSHSPSVPHFQGQPSRVQTPGNSVYYNYGNPQQFHSPWPPFEDDNSYEHFASPPQQSVSGAHATQRQLALQQYQENLRQQRIWSALKLPEFGVLLQPEYWSRLSRLLDLPQDLSYLHTAGGMPPNPNAAAQAHQRQIYEQQMQQRNAALEHQLAQRRARKPTDRNMPEGVEDLVLGDEVHQYKELREVEKKLDYAMMRKRLDIQDTVSRNVKRQKTMRIWISNTCENQPWQRGALDENAFDFNTGADSTFKVKIEGKILDELDEDIMNSDEEGEEDAKKMPPSTKKFSHFFKQITVEYDKNRGMPGQTLDPGMQIEWKKGPHNTADFDCMEFTRKADENMNVTINLVRDEQLERYRLSQALANTLDIEEADRAEVVMSLWEYVKANGLQEDEERRHVRCDDRLRQIIGGDSFLFPQVADRIQPHLHPLPPIKLNYTIRVDQEFFSSSMETDSDSQGPPPFGEATIYDIPVTTDDPLRSRILAMTSNTSTISSLRQISQLDDQLATLIQAIGHHKAKHTFYRNFNKDPVAFLQKWYASQQHDLSVLLGEVDKGDVAGLEFSKGGKEGVWGSDIVNEAVRYRLAKAEAAK